MTATSRIGVNSLLWPLVLPRQYYETQAGVESKVIRSCTFKERSRLGPLATVSNMDIAAELKSGQYADLHDPWLPHIMANSDNTFRMDADRSTSSWNKRKQESNCAVTPWMVSGFGIQS